MKYLDGSTFEGTIHQSSQMFYSKAFEVLSLPPSLINPESSVPFFALENGYNNFLEACLKSSKIYYDKLKDITSYSTKSSEIAVIVVCCVLTFFAVLFISFWILALVRRPKNELLKIFLQVPNEKILRYQSKCEKFLTYIGNDESESELNSSVDMNREDAGNDEEENLLKKRRNARKVRFSKEIIVVVAKLLGFFLVVFGYFYFTVYRFSSLMEKVGGVIEEFNNTSLMMPMSYLYDNAQR